MRRRLLVSAAQMRALDAATISDLGVPGLVLMESAGRGVVTELWALHGRGLIDLRRGQVLVVAGPGNNGGDGLVIARTLHGAGVVVQVLLCAPRERLRGDAHAQLRMALAAGVPLHDLHPSPDAPPTLAVLQRLRLGDVIVDALLGTGLTRAVAAPDALAAVITAVNDSPALRVAVDVPSGLDADRGEPATPEHGDGQDDAPAAIVRADHTVTFGWAKLGLVSAPGYRYAGRVTVTDIGIPVSLAAAHGVRTSVLGPEVLRPAWTPRDPDGHKGSHGHLLILAGSPGKTGAALLAMRGAQAVGVGLCTVATPRSAAAVVQGRALEAMTLAYPDPDSDAGSDAGSDAAALCDAWEAAARGKRAIAIGPGLPAAPAISAALRHLLAHGDAALVLDAEALNLLADDLSPVQKATARGRTIVLTPHPGEAARLLGTSTRDVQGDRVAAARALNARSGAVVLLKGARTVLTDGADLCICATGNAGMGCGGMGDVLTGMIGALLANGLLHAHRDRPGATGAHGLGLQAACAAAYWHGLAGDCLLAERFPAALLRAGDLCDFLPAAVQRARVLYDQEAATHASQALHRPLLPEASPTPKPRLH